MHLTEVQCLTPEYTQEDVNEFAAVVQSVLLTTPLSTMRWGKVKPEDCQSWLRDVVGKKLKRELEAPRITTLQHEASLPDFICAEHLVIRDLDMERLDQGSTDVAPGRMVAHADYRYVPAYSSHSPATPEKGPKRVYPQGFREDLQTLLDGQVESTLLAAFQGLPCFELEGLSTLTPSHIRKGIAKKLVEWVFPYADQFAVPTVLAASPLGLFLYRKCGFVEYRKYDIKIKLDGWEGGEHLHQHIVMVRWPNDIGRMPDAWKEWKRVHDADQ